MLGQLGFDDLPHDPIVWGGALSVIGGGIGIVLLITFLKRWKWLYKEWLTTLDPKKIGVMYIIVALVMMLRGLGDAAMMRVQQALATGDSSGILTSDHFQQVLTAHGTIMIFFVAMGLMFGIINLILPLQLGARDVAFPFLNSVSFWLFFMGMVLINASLVVGEFAATGWLAYPPLSGIEYSPGVGVDYWLWALQLSGVGSLLSGINFLVTILKMRAPGMTMMKMPIFSWSVFGSMLLVIFSFPILTATLAMLSLDRLLGMHFFTSDMGGNPMMYINLIWAWGHPEVYILILPAFGIFSEIVATFSRKAIFGYTSMVAAIMAISFFSYIVWLHHFFTMGAGANVNAFFGIATMVIAIPTGVKVFNWLFTMYRGRVLFTSPMYWFFAFVTTFTIGGMTGMIHAVPAIDFQMHNSLFLVAHFHNMIIGGVVFGYFAGLTYWFPKIFGFTLHDGLGKAAAWCWGIGFVGAFGPLYILGIMGATRRLDRYDESLGWQGLFIVAGVGLMIIMLGAALQALQLLISLKDRARRRDVTGDPWDGRTLEWSVPSPAPYYNFAIEPAVTTRDAFWHMKQTKHAYQLRDFKPFHLPKNTSLGLFIAFAGFLMSFAIIWHIWWLLIVGLVLLVALIIIRSSQTETEYEVTKDMVQADLSRRLA